MRGVWLVMLVAASACVKQAPSTYEMDARSGFAVPRKPTHSKVPRAHRKALAQAGYLETMWTVSTPPAPGPEVPLRVQPVVEKVWVPGHLHPDGSYQQGTVAMGLGNGVGLTFVPDPDHEWRLPREIETED